MNKFAVLFSFFIMGCDVKGCLYPSDPVIPSSDAGSAIDASSLDDLDFVYDECETECCDDSACCVDN